jgi:hypothetical protein
MAFPSSLNIDAKQLLDATPLGVWMCDQLESFVLI